MGYWLGFVFVFLEDTLQVGVILSLRVVEIVPVATGGKHLPTVIPKSSSNLAAHSVAGVVSSGIPSTQYSVSFRVSNPVSHLNQTPVIC